MKVKTADLTGRALDWAVAEVIKPAGFSYRLNDEYEPPEPILGMVEIPNDIYFRVLEIDRDNWLSDLSDKPLTGCWHPSTDWSQSGPLIEEHSLNLTGSGKNNIAVVRVACGCVTQSGDTLLIAFCRALVAAKLGDEVDIPDELMEGVSQ